MKIKEQIAQWQKEMQNCQELVTKTNANTEKYCLEVKELKESVNRLVKTNAEIVVYVLSLLKQQLGD